MKSRTCSRLTGLWLLCALMLPAAQAAPSASGIQWNPWSAQTFARARAEQKPVFLYLEAVWCHWCHVMQRETLARAEVQAALAKDFIAVRVDHDADPGLANRYRDYGWPALVFLSPEGMDLVKRAGYIAPDNFSRLLNAIARDPTPESDASLIPAPAGPSQLDVASRAYLLRRHEKSYDSRLGGLRTAQKFVDRDSVEYALAHADDPAERIKATQTLDAARALIDPVWGGAYQYSTGGVWSNAHFEKIMRTQAGMLRVYALAYGRLGRNTDLDVAYAIKRYLTDFLRTPSGAFRVSQDADVVPGQKSAAYFALDDAARRKIGLPRIDPNLYADANGLAAEALATLYAFSGDTSALAAARAAANWALTERKGANGLLRHGQAAEQYPHLSDSLFLARAALTLYEVTAERRWLAVSDDLAQAINLRLRAPEAGFVTGQAEPGVPVQPLPDLAENIATARFFNRLSHYTGNAAHRDAALHAMKYLAGHASRQQDFEEAGILLADEELSRDPVHLTVVGAKTDAVAQDLFRTALKTPGAYRRIEWWDRAEGPLTNSDVEYPKFAKAAAYVCTAGRCSRPSNEPADYAAQIQRLTAAK